MKNPFETLIQNCHNLEINIGDTFAWGCADSESIEGGDALDLIPFIEKYGDEAIVAFVSVKRELLEDSLNSPMLLDKSYEKYFGKDVEEEIPEKYLDMINEPLEENTRLWNDFFKDENDD